MDFDSEKDVGIYRCSILIGSEYLKSTEWRIIGETFLTIRNESLRYNLIGLESFGGEIEFKVFYSGYPVTAITWFDNYDELISWTENENENAKFVARKSLQEASLKIRYLNIRDLGNFVFYADNKYHSKKLTFVLSLEGKVKSLFTFTEHRKCRLRIAALFSVFGEARNFGCSRVSPQEG